MTQRSADEVGAGKPQLLLEPEHCPGAYVMFFYCKYSNPAHPYQSTSSDYMEEAAQVETRGQAISQMRRSGWKYHRDGTATCPLCVRALITQPAEDEQP